MYVAPCLMKPGKDEDLGADGEIADGSCHVGVRGGVPLTVEK
jgi:hypothetical protein